MKAKGVYRFSLENTFSFVIYKEIIKPWKNTKCKSNFSSEKLKKYDFRNIGIYFNPN